MLRLDRVTAQKRHRTVQYPGVEANEANFQNRLVRSSDISKVKSSVFKCGSLTDFNALESSLASSDSSVLHHFRRRFKRVICINVPRYRQQQQQQQFRWQGNGLVAEQLTRSLMLTQTIKIALMTRAGILMV
jgi:hypothetical protein